MFIDTHCHLNMMVKNEPDVPLQAHHFPIIAQIIAEAENAGVGKIINVGTSIPESLNAITIATRFETVFATVGLHPCDCNDMTDGVLTVMNTLEKLLKHKEENKIVALGETGLDFYHQPFNKQRQIDFFKAHLETSLEYNLPLVVHVRESSDEVLRVLEEYIKHGARGVIHCFLQSLDFAKMVTGWGFYVGLDAPITYPKNGWMRDVFKQIPLEHIILETDAPFLPPQQFRGKQNSPVYIPLIAEQLAQIKGITPAIVEQQTTKNAQSLFSV